MDAARRVSAFVGGFSSTHSSPSESSTFIAWYCSQKTWQISKSVSVAAVGMSSSMDIHSSYFSFCIPSGGSKTITDGHVPINSWFVWGKIALDVSLQVEREILRTSIVNAVENEGSVISLLQN
ncbi:hypothetical protein AVEN_11068-1 [Araneus ventricosus]|uniref:Uncharacterized protein n=1 Tax=Araneus ventricosus TaxID=182803 RepID=A0A4Y2P535_ARAVE|nr:hypothetical protein AVEN_11068-1 [Araneus ventricosus]